MNEAGISNESAKSAEKSSEEEDDDSSSGSEEPKRSYVPCSMASSASEKPKKTTSYVSCSVVGCMKYAQSGAGGMCRSHYNETLHDSGKKLTLKPRQEKGFVSCSVPGCGKYAQSKCQGMCQRHYTEGVRAKERNNVARGAPTQAPALPAVAAAAAAASPFGPSAASALGSSAVNPRKRPRSTSPLPAGDVTSAPAASTLPTSAASMAEQLRSSDPAVSVSALNVLLSLSSDDRANFALGEGGEEVVEALVGVFDDAIGWTSTVTHATRDKEEEDKKESPDDLEEEETFEPGVEDAEDLKPSAKTWDVPDHNHKNQKSTAAATENGNNFDDGPFRGKNETWASFCTRRLSSPHAHSIHPTTAIHPSSRVTDAEMSILRNIALIIRNLSYVAGNARFLVHNPGLLRILTGCLYFRAFTRAEEDDRGRAGGADNSNACLFALHALLNLVPWLDSTGRKVFADMILLDPSAAQSASGGDEVRSVVPKTGYGMAPTLGFGGMLIAKKFEVRDEALSAVPGSVVRTLVPQHIRAVLGIFPALRYCLFAHGNRAALSSTMELMSSLLDIGGSENQAVFLNIPDDVLDRLTDLMYFPRLGPDSVEYVDPVCNTVSRISTLKLLQGYDVMIDSDLRDRACEVLVKLTGLGPDLKRRVGRGRRGRRGRQQRPQQQRKGQHLPNVRLYDSLVPMLTTKAGRGDAPQLAGRLLANLSVVPENAAGMAFVEARVVQAAGRDAHVANVVCNGVLNHIA